MPDAVPDAVLPDAVPGAPGLPDGDGGVGRFVVLLTWRRSQRVLSFGPYGERAEAEAIADILRLHPDGPGVAVDELRDAGELIRQVREAALAEGLAPPRVPSAIRRPEGWSDP